MRRRECLRERCTLRTTLVHAECAGLTFLFVSLESLGIVSWQCSGVVVRAGWFLTFNCSRASKRIG